MHKLREDIDSKYGGFIDKYTPKKRKYSQEHLHSQHLDNNNKHTQGKTNPTHKFNLSSLKPDSTYKLNLKDTWIHQDNQDKERTSSRRGMDSYNSISNDKKNLSTFRTDKERLAHPSRSKDDPIKHTLTSFELLLLRNEKLAIRVGELESACDTLTQKSSLVKDKCADEIRKAESRYHKELKEKVYCEKLAYFYKSKALEYLRLLEENGVHVDNVLTEESLTEESQLK